MLSPFSGQLQIVETDDARALSLDGRHWGIHFRIGAAGDPHRPRTSDDARADYRYARVGSIVDNRVERIPLPRVLQGPAVALAVDRLAQLVTDASLPFDAIDTFEYWLLDASDRKPLALLRSEISAQETSKHPPMPDWLTMPATQLKIEDPGPATADYVAPVNQRLQKLIEERAGWNPKGAWFDRSDAAAEEFPPCLISESWEREEHDRLCRLYIGRLAPRLLTLHGLPRDDRRRLELAARDHALEVERFYPLYPEIVDRKLIRALRVEARLRRGPEPESS